MRTQAIVVGVLCVAVAAAVFTIAPLGGTLLDGTGDDIQTGEVQDQANDSAANGGFNGSAETEGEGSLVGTIVSGAQNIFRIVGMIALVPNLLQSVGMPFWFAQPVGWMATIIGGIGALQFVTGRRYT